MGVMDLDLEGKGALVTGGSRGTGTAIARHLAREGVSVAIVARDHAALEATARAITVETGQRVVPLVADTGRDAAVRRMMDSALAAFGRVEILVTCAAQAGGHAPAPTFAEVTDDVDWADGNVKVIGHPRCARELAPHLSQSGWGRMSWSAVLRRDGPA